MKNVADRIILVIYVALLAAFLFYVAFKTDMPRSKDSYLNVHYIDILDSWVNDKGKRIKLDDIPRPEKGREQVFSMKIPKGIRKGESLNFISRNLRFRVYVDKALAYDYMPAENVTGMGTGTVYHTIPLSEKTVGKDMMIKIIRPFEGEKGGYFIQAKICNSRDFTYLTVHQNAGTYILSMLIIFFGIVILIIHFSVFHENHMGYDLLGLGMATSILGCWTLIESNVAQMIAGPTVGIRVLDYVMLSFVDYPLVCFIISITKQKKVIFKYIAFAIGVVSAGLVILLKAVGGIDMHRNSWILFAGYAACIITTAALLVDNRRYCKKRGIKENLTYFYIGAAALTAGVIMDIVRYLFSGNSSTNNGYFVRVGMMIFIITMFVQIIKWVTQVRKKSTREEFVNSLMHSSMSGKSAEDTLKQMVEYLGEGLNADRAYIFEDMNDGTFRATYTWHRAEVEEDGTHAIVKFDGVVDAFYAEYDKSGSIIVDDVARYKESYPVLYNTLTKRGINSLINAPIISGDKYVGFFGVNNPPLEKGEEAVEIIQYLKYFFSEAFERRATEEKLISYSYYDQMTGVGNRRAVGEFEAEKLDTSKPFGFVMCDINGLKRVNDNEGHEAGDKMIKDVADAMREVFGKQLSFRMGGDEFAAYKVCDSEEEFIAAIDRLKAGIAERGRSASIGYVYTDGTAEDINELKKKADLMMYEDKERYYSGRSDRRRR